MKKMKTKINLSKREYQIIGIALVAGLFFGWLFFHGPAETKNREQIAEGTGQGKKTIWTCSMHPQIRMDKPGKCPICGMDLILLVESSVEETTISPDEISLTESALKIADIQTMVVQKAYPNKELYLLGKVEADERNISELTARFGGRIEKLYVNFTGQDVNKGEPLASIYSPALITAQRELLEAQEYRQSNPELYRAARNKLKLWDLTDGQIDNLENKGQAQNYFDILSSITGTVTRRNVALGDYVKEGSSLFQVIDLNKVWVMFEAYESDLPWIKLGDKVNFTIQSLPGKNFTGRVSFIDPLIDPKTRIAQVRVEVENPGLVLKPEMFATGVVTSTIAGNKKDLIVPKTAVLWTGKRAVVYVKVPNRKKPTFKYREIVLGPAAGNFYVVDHGLKEGEEIAVNGVFKIDAAAQLAGKPSMMNPEGGVLSSGHDHAQMSDGQENMVMNVGFKEEYSDQQTVDLKRGKTDNDKMDMDSQETKIDPGFKEQLTSVYNAYLALKNALVESSSDEVAQIAEEVGNALKRVDMELLSGETHMLWMDQLGKLKESLEIMEQNPEVKIQREAFASFNLTFYQSVKDFGLEGVTTYYQYCPMAVNQKGAFWFSEIKEIKNPYFGEAMLSCGETRETLEF
jgi:Cu(I)/Ag(I) efflux system membrane fusion protein